MATAHDHVVKAEQLLAKAQRQDPLGTEPEDIPAFALLTAQAQVHAALAAVRLELEARAAENARTDRLLAEVKPSPRSLDPRANRKAAEQRLRGNKKPPTAATDEGPR
jgi:hypothetical protein